MSVFASRRFKPSAPEKHSTPGSDFALMLQPATLKPSAPQLRCGVRCPIRQGQARRHGPRRPSAGRRRPSQTRSRALAFVAAQLAQMDERMHDHPFAHPVGEIGIDHAHDRLVGQGRIGKQMIDAGAEREDRLKVGKVWRARPADGASSARSGSEARSNGSSSVATEWDGSSVSSRLRQDVASQPETARRMFMASRQCARPPGRRAKAAPLPMR